MPNPLTLTAARPLLLASLLAVVVATPAASHPLPSAPKCRIFPASNPWNRRVDRLPVATEHAAVVRTIGPTPACTPTSAPASGTAAPIGIPFTVVREDARRVRVSLRLRGRVRQRPVPDPEERRGSRAAATSDGDRHALIVDRDACKLYELYALHPTASGAGRPARARSGPALEQAAPRRLDVGRRGRPADPARARALRRRRERPDRPRAPLHRPSTRAAPTSIRRGTTRATDRPGPAADGPALPAASRATRSPASRRRRAIVLVALKRYGMIVADNGSNWYISGAPEPALVERPAAHPRPGQGLRLRGRGHLEASSLA